MTEYDIVYTVRRRRADDDDYVEIGFGASGGSSTPDDAAYAMSSDIQNLSWETEGDMPDPEEIKREMEATDD